MKKITAAQFKASATGATKGRVRGTKRVTIDGITFDSKREAGRWLDLRRMERAGIITNLRRQRKFELQGKDGPILTPTGRVMIYKADFTYFDKRINAEVVEDAKGWATDVYKLKRAILAAQGVEVTEV